MSRGRRQARSQASTSRVLEAALELFSSQGFRATSMRQIAAEAGLSAGNLYHHFCNKEAIFQRLMQDYWDLLQDPAQPLARLFAGAGFPEDLEEMARLIAEVVEENAAYILLLYVDVIEFHGEHIRAFYEGMAQRFAQVYGEKLEARKRNGEFGEIDPLVAVMLATRWLFYFYTVEKAFGVPLHFGLPPEKATEEFIRLLRFGLVPRCDGSRRAVTDPQPAGKADGTDQGRQHSRPKGRDTS